MGNWRNRLAQESYTFKVIGSSPIFPTKKCKIVNMYLLIQINMRNKFRR